jgi:hypothetical protein
VGIMEGWNIGIMGQTRRNAMMEWWKIGIMEKHSRPKLERQYRNAEECETKGGKDKSGKIWVDKCCDL